MGEEQIWRSRVKRYKPRTCIICKGTGQLALGMAQWADAISGREPRPRNENCHYIWLGMDDTVDTKEGRIYKFKRVGDCYHACWCSADCPKTAVTKPKDLHQAKSDLS